MSSLPVAPAEGIHLVIGAGEVGTAVARLLARAGRRVVILTRSGSGPEHELIDRRAADASSVDALISAAPAAAVLYNCVNPPYNRWPELWPPMAAAFLSYAQRTGAVLATVSNLYGYGPVNGPMTESLPLVATGAKARVRAQMWLAARDAHDAGLIRATEVRGSDYICPGPQSLLGDRVVPNVLAGRPVLLLGNLDQPHTWTAPVDVARTLISAAADPGSWGRPWHVPSNPPRSQRQAVSDLAAAAGVPAPRVSAVPRALYWALCLFNPLMRELRETDYQRERAYVLNDTDARRTFGLEPTPWGAILTAMVAKYRQGK